MIHTNELMLGNWVEYATGLNGEKRSIPMYVKAIDEDEALLSFEGNEADLFIIEDKDLLGIPITEELLEKCGFRCDWKYNKIWELGCVLFEFEDSRKWVLCRWGQRIENIEFLHELQNAYFMLTKKHLDVKL